MASHSTAAALHRLDGCRRDEPIHLYAPTGWRAPGVKVHRTRTLPACDVISIGAIPTTDCSRTLLDLGAVADEEVVEVALECALHRGLTSVPRLRWRLQQVGGRGRPGAALLRRLLDLREGHGRPAQSVLEAEQRDSRRHNELTGLGWRILYFTWDDIDHRIDYVIACIEDELRPWLV